MADGPLTNRILNGRYQLSGRVGGGGMALVYRARDITLGRTVAVKVLRDQYGSDPRFLQRFVREAQAAANLNHPNIVNVYDVGQEGDVHYIVMEFIAGETLRQYMDRNGGKLDADTAAEIGAQVCAALAAAHRAGIVHRDVKPQNVLISTDGIVKVTDFGIAKGLTDMSMTETGVALGTVQYFSPEQARGERVLAQSDLYSVGVILYEMLAGRQPFEADTMMGIALKHIEEQPMPLHQLVPDVPRGLEAIVLKALSKDPTQRFTTAEEMEQALRDYRNYVPRRSTGAQAQQGATIVANQPRRQPTQAQQANYEQQRPPLPPLKTDTRLPAQRQSTYIEADKSGPGLGSWIIGILALLFLLGGVIFAFTVLPTLSQTNATPTPMPNVVVAPPTDTTIPPTATPSVLPPVANVARLTYTNAITTLSGQGYKVNIQTQANASPLFPFGTVISQDPAPGTSKLAPGSTVTLTVSLGPRRIHLPDYRNTDSAAAATSLKNAGLNPAITDQPSSLPKGVVVDQDPAPNTDVEEGATVTLKVSTGQP